MLHPASSPVTPTRTRVKICGFTRMVDIEAAIALGVDAVGLVFYPPSPRAVNIEQAAALAQAAPAFVSTVGLFVDAAPDWVRAVLARVPLAALQFHGQESPEYCASFARPWLKALAVAADTDVLALTRRYAQAASWLLDTFDPTLAGGTGRAFDWRAIPPALAGRIVLAGGLNPDNVAAAIAQVRPHAVDVSSGVEYGKGLKDAAKMAAFMQGVRDGDRSRESIFRS